MAVKSSFLNMVACLGAITLVCSALLGVLHEVTAAPIQAAAAAKTQNAIAEVLPEFDTLGELQEAEGGSYYLASKNGEVVGVAVNAKSSGFGGTLKLMVGFYTDGRICNTSVLEHSETPGLGAKCTEPKFADQFKGFDPSVKKLSVSKDGGDVDAITASTITSRAFCVALENAVKVFQSVAQTPAPCCDECCGECGGECGDECCGECENKSEEGQCNE